MTDDIAAELVRACAGRREISQSIVDFIAPTASRHQRDDYNCIQHEPAAYNDIQS